MPPPIAGAADRFETGTLQQTGDILAVLAGADHRGQGPVPAEFPDIEDPVVPESGDIGLLAAVQILHDLDPAYLDPAARKKQLGDDLVDDGHQGQQDPPTAFLSYRHLSSFSFRALTRSRSRAASSKFFKEPGDVVIYFSIALKIQICFRKKIIFVRLTISSGPC